MRPRPDFDLSIYFVADPSLCGGRDVADVVRAAAQGGATLVQLRNKSGNAREFLQQARNCRDVLKNFNVPLIINDRVDIAMAAGADGVHLGQGDLPPAEARRILGPEKIIGVTAFQEEHFRAIDPAVVDYAGMGPFYVTKTDKRKPVLGAEGFMRLVEISPVPVVGIGGITPQNAAAVMQCGAAGVAMMRAVSEADDPVQAVSDFMQEIKQHCHPERSARHDVEGSALYPNGDRSLDFARDDRKRKLS